MTLVPPPQTALVVHDAEGRILRRVYGVERAVVEPALEPGQTVWEGDADDVLHWISDGERQDRPGMNLPAEHTVSADVEWHIPDVPAGTVVVVDGIEMGMYDGGITFEAPHDGEPYVVRLVPPFPWREAQCVVRVA